MFHNKSKLAIGLALIVLSTTAAMAASTKGDKSAAPKGAELADNQDALKGRVGFDDNSPDIIKRRTGSGNPLAGKDKSLLCQGCHGEEGISVEPQIPKLAGQYAGYIAKQVHDFQNGFRSNAIMNGMAATVDDADLPDIAAYFASRNKMKGDGSANALGRNLFLNGDMTRMMVACINCHGVNGKGKTPDNSMFPVIGGQQKEYLRIQLTNFRQGDRANSPGGVMNIITQKLTNAEIEALAEYVSGL
jgi:cytochrome c553